MASHRRNRAYSQEEKEGSLVGRGKVGFCHLRLEATEPAPHSLLAAPHPSRDNSAFWLPHTDTNWDTSGPSDCSGIAQKGQSWSSRTCKVRRLRPQNLPVSMILPHRSQPGETPSHLLRHGVTGGRRRTESHWGCQWRCHTFPGVLTIIIRPGPRETCSECDKVSHPVAQVAN